MSSAPRRPRRAVRPPGTVGGDESVLRSVLPAISSGDDGSSAGQRRAAVPDVTGGGTGPDTPEAARDTETTRVGAPTLGDGDDLWRATRSADDSDRGWGREEPTTNDDRLRREKPPHW